MRLQVQLPVLVARIYGKYRNRITHEAGWESLLTTVHAVRYISPDDGPDVTMVEADAFIPEHRRRGLDVRASRWVTPEILRVNVWVAENRKTLAPFLASGDREWDLREKP